MNTPLFPDDDGSPVSPAPAVPSAPRLRYAERQQMELRCASLDQLLPPEHPVRLVWDYVAALDLTPLEQAIQAVAGRPGRAATDPRLLVALWLQATTDGVGSARELDRLCTEHIAYQWLCGGVSLNYHTLADFRTRHPDFLRQLLTDSVASLQHQGLIDLKRVAQDGLRVRASAGASSFRRRPSLERCLDEARQQVAALEKQLDEDAGAVCRRQQAARERAAGERVARLQQALREHEDLHARREQQRREKGTKFDAAELRTSTTDPEARKMKMPDGGTRPAYNVQFATTTEGSVIVGVDVTNAGSDSGQLAPMVEQIKRQCGQAPEEMLVDGGFTKLDDIESVQSHHGTKVYGPVKDEDKKQAAGVDPFQPRPRDKPGVAAWRQRMGTEEGKAIYRQRAETAEWVNAGARNRGLYQVRVRSRAKVLAVALWYALAHNLLRGAALRRQSEKESRAKQS